MIQLTDWFPANVKPVRKGVYITSIRAGAARIEGYSYWNGRHWCNQHNKIKGAQARSRNGAGMQDKRWRGLVEKPE